MTINKYVKDWCLEDYDVRKEDFYVDNAVYIVNRAWGKGGLWHSLVSIAAFVVVMGFNYNNGFGTSFFAGTISLGITAVSFLIYAIKAYNRNNWKSGIYSYAFLTVLLWIILSKALTFVKIIFSVVSCGLFLYESVYRPVVFFMATKSLKERIAAERREEAAADRQSYAAWSDSYKAFRYGLPEYTASSEDPLLVKARELFKGFCDNKQVLKTRYRQLAKEYHPDMGGDTALFQCIIQVYNEIGETLNN